MALRHPMDPKRQTEVAATAGKLVAQGLLEPADILDKIFAVAASRAPRDLSRAGLRTRLAWHIADHADHWRRERDRAEFLIRRDLRPLLDAREPTAALLATAHAINDHLGEPLLTREVRAVVEDSVRAALLAMRPRRRVRGRV